MAAVPDRADKRVKYYVTNDGVGTDNNQILRHQIYSTAGRAAMRRAVDEHAKRTGKTSRAYVEGRPYDEKSQKTIYTKEVK